MRGREREIDREIDKERERERGGGDGGADCCSVWRSIPHCGDCGRPMNRKSSR